MEAKHHSPRMGQSLPVWMCILASLTSLLAACENLSISSGQQTVMDPIGEDIDRTDSIGSLNMANKFRAHIDPASAVALPSDSTLAFGDSTETAPKSTDAEASPVANTGATVQEDSGVDKTPRSNGMQSSSQASASLLVTPNQPVKYTSELASNQGLTPGIPTEIAPETRLSKVSTPEDVCRVFVKALSTGDHIAASKMLTNIAQIETARANLELESPGSEDAIWEVLDAEYATAEKKIAQVRCLLKEPGAQETAHLTWLMRLQGNGWKISGMSIQVSGTGDVDLLSFENPLDLQRVQSTVDPVKSPNDSN